MERLVGLGAGVLGLHIAGWGLFLLFAHPHPELAGLGPLAYALGLRHAFDADHIAAIDNTTRKLLQDGRPAHGAGFFFALGHSSGVFALGVAVVVAAKAVSENLPSLSAAGGYAAVGVSGGFLLVIGILNLVVLLDIVRIFRRMRDGSLDEEALEARLRDRGLASRFFLRRTFRLVGSAWHLYPLGLLFGLGFDTATETGLLALAAGAAADGVPMLAILSLPLIFAAAMTAVDTADGVFMTHAYCWAFSNPVRRIYYNLTVTALTVATALAIGSTELLQVLASRLNLTSGVWRPLHALDVRSAGYAIVALFVFAWATSAFIWKARRIEARWSAYLERS